MSRTIGGAATAWSIRTHATALQTMQRMAAMCHKAMLQPRVIYAANQVVAHIDPRDYRQQIAAIRAFVQRYFKFIGNPVGTQTIRPPGWTTDPWTRPGMLQDIELTGETHGACDDAAVLVATLGMANSIRARFRALAFCYEMLNESGSDTVCDPDVPFTHVIADLYDGSVWHELDVTRPDDLTRPPSIARELALSV